MEKLRTKLVNAMLRHDGLVAVPESWQTEYVKLAGDKVRNGQTIAELIKAYNELLEDNLNRCNIKELKEMITDAGGVIPAEKTKEALVNTAFLEYRMRKEGK